MNKRFLFIIALFLCIFLFPVIADNTLRVYLPFNEDAATDYSQYANPATVNHTKALWTTGYSGGGFDVNGTFGTQRPTINFSATIINTTLNYTYSLWIKHNESYSSDLISLPANDSSGWATPVGSFRISSSHKMQILTRYKTNHTAITVTANTPILNPNEWYNVVATHSTEGIFNIYVNGVLYQQTTYDTTSGLVESKAKLAIDNNQGGINYFFNGTIDEIKIWNRTLTQSEITNLYESDYHSLTNVTVTPDYPLTTSSLKCSATALNGLGEYKYNISYMMFVNGVPQSYNASTQDIYNNTVGTANDSLSGTLNVGDRIICSAKAFTNGEYTKWYNSSTTTIMTCDSGNDIIAIIIFFVFLMLLFGYITFFHFQNNMPLRIFMLLLTVGMIVVCLIVTTQLSEQIAPDSICQDDDKVYGSLYNFSNAGWAMGIANTATYYNFTISTTGYLNGFKRINDGGTEGTKLQAQVAGLYAVDAVVTATFTAGEYGIGVVTNGANPEVLGRCYTRSNLNGQHPVAITCLKRLYVNDNVTLVVDDESTPVKDITIYTINLRLMRIAE